MSIATRSFDLADQERFAALSGDYNPMHLDAVAARRTVAGEPVVHGLHLALWALEAFAASEAELPPVAQVRADFARFVTLGDAVALSVHKRTDKLVQLRLMAGGTVRSELFVTWGEAKPAVAIDGERVEIGETPLDLTLEQMGGRRGRIGFAAPAGDLAAAFPQAAAWLGARRVAALAASTRIVGMICPGLHSLYAGFRLDLTEDEGADALGFAAGEARHRMIGIEVAGGGIAGKLNSVARMPPTPQPTMAELAGLVAPEAFAGAHALVIGGSRGLGELAAKLVASGSGRVTISYRVGRAEAEAVAAEIRAGGGACDLLAYQVGEPAEAQLAALADAPTHAYYFATPVIARPNSAFFDAARLRELEGYFVDGFWALASALRTRRPEVRLFYPSTVFIDERPKGMAEYAMAKAAGEQLCAEINATLGPTRVIVTRLPKMLTDQTAGPLESDTADPVAALLPVVREVQG